MKAWIGNLAHYNAGRLTGQWVEISDDTDDNAAAIARICGDVEHYVGDYDEMPASLGRILGEYAGAEDLAQAMTLWSAMLTAANDDEELAAEFLDAYCGQWPGERLPHLIDNAADFVESYAGSYDTLAHFGEEHCEEMGILDSIPEQYRGYFDCEAYARDLQLGGALWTHRANGDLMIFWSR